LGEILSSINNGTLKTAGYKFQWIDELLRDTLVQNDEKPILSKFDRIATHRKWETTRDINHPVGLIASFIPATPIMYVGSLIPYWESPSRQP